MKRLLAVSLLAGCGLVEPAHWEWAGLANEVAGFRRPPAIQTDERGHVLTFALANPQPAAVEVALMDGSVRRFQTGGESQVELPLPEVGMDFRYRVLVGDADTTWQTYREPRSPLHLAVLGDSRPEDGVPQPVVFRQLMTTVSQQAQAAVVLGDMVQLTPKKVRPITQGWVNEVYDAFLQAASPVMGSMPFMPVLGNHDAPWSEKAEAGFRSAFVLPQNGRSERYYSRDLAGVRLVVLDSEENFLFKKARLSDHQMAWLRRTLAGRSNQRCFVFLHRPLFGGSHGDDFGNGNPAQRDQLHALFRQYGVTAVFAGHDHRYDFRLVDGIPYVISGGAGSPIRGRDEAPGVPQQWFAHHWVKVSVTPQKVVGEAIGLDGRHLHQWEVR